MNSEIFDLFKKLDYFSVLRILNFFNEIKNLSSDEFKFLCLIIDANIKNSLVLKENKDD